MTDTVKEQLANLKSQNSALKAELAEAKNTASAVSKTHSTEVTALKNKITSLTSERDMAITEASTAKDKLSNAAADAIAAEQSRRLAFDSVCARISALGGTLQGASETEVMTHFLQAQGHPVGADASPEIVAAMFATFEKINGGDDANQHLSHKSTADGLNDKKDDLNMSQQQRIAAIKKQKETK